MPLSELKKYQGSSPCPADLDEFWAKALAELDDTGTDYELVEADFRAPGVLCYDLYFTGVGNARIHCKFLRPEKIEGKIPAIAMFHGYSGDCGGFFEKLPYAYAGYAVLALDVRGQAGKSDDTQVVSGNTLFGHVIRGLSTWNPNNLFFRNVYLDAAKTARILMAMDFVDETKVGAMGGSQGGALTLACAALEPRVARMAPNFPFLCDFKRIWNIDLCSGAYDEFAKYLRTQDPRHEHIDKFFGTLAYIDLANLTPRIRAKTKWFIGLMDNICPPSTQFAAYNHMTAEREMVIYPDFGHEGLPDCSEITFRFFEEMK